MADTFEGELDIIGIPKVTIALLKTFPLSAGGETRKDGSLVYVVATEKLYRWDADSTETPDDINIVQSSLSATGRWIATAEAVNNVVHKFGTEQIDGNKTFGGNTKFEQDVTIYDDLGVGGTGDNLNGQIRVRDKNGVTKFDLEGKDTGAVFIFNSLPAITDILQGVGGGATNHALLTSDYFTEHPTSTSTAINTNNSSSPNYFAGLVISGDGQTAFTISQTPYTAKNTILLLNGQMRNYGVDFTVLGTALTWLDPVEGVSPKTLKTTDELIVMIGYSISGAVVNHNENGIIVGGYWNGANWISNNPNINILFDIPDNSLSDATGRISVAHGITSGSVITNNDLKVITYFEQEQAARVDYGFGSGTLELNDPQITNISTDGSVVTCVFDRLIINLKAIGDKIEIVNTTNYDGLYTITDIPAGGYTIKFSKVGSHPVETTGYARLEYSPQPHHNQRGVFIPSAQNIRIIERIATLADGFYMDLRKDNVADAARIIPEGSVELMGVLTSGTAKTWTSASPQFPLIEKHETLRLRKQKDNKWWLEFVKVSEA